MLISLDDSWRIQSSADIQGGGERLSRPALDVSGWYPAALPATVLGTLVENGVYGDPFTGTNFLRIPGQGPPHENFSLHPMPEDSPFRVPWWFRREFRVDGDGAETWLEFLGINYRANVWLNGQLVADAGTVAGAYRTYEFLVSERVRPGAVNALAIEVFPPEPDELAITWVDWNPSPPDKNMGLWQRASLRHSGPIALRDAQVVVELEPGGRAAALTVHVTAINATDRPQHAVVTGSVAGLSIRTDVTLDARERRTLTLAGVHGETRLDHPRLWWPRGLGAQPLYQLSLVAESGARVSDTATRTFGIRQVTSELTDRGHALFRVNGRPVLVRGGGWSKDLFQRENAERDLYEYEYAKDIGLNAIRFEGMLERDAFLDRCDRDGMLVIAGWCCCDHWERWDAWKPADHDIAAESLRAQVRRVRHHPAVIAWWYGSDNPPPAPVERRYLEVLREERWPNPAHSSASQKPAELTGASGMKMLGPYDYVPPAYWYTDRSRGGAFGFATEIGPGAAIPPLESLRSVLTDAHLWPPDECWSLHCGGGVFKDLTRFGDALARRYGLSPDIDDFAAKAQLSAYESQRAMFEAYTRNRYDSTGVIQWMLNNAWPSLIWHLWDWYLRPGGGYFGAKKACQPLHVQYSYDDRTVVAINMTGRAAPDLEVQARLLALDSTELFTRTAAWDAPADSAGRVFQVPVPRDSSTAYFLRLDLRRRESSLASNLYWLSTTPDTVDDDRGNWYYTPMTAHADLTGLAQLPRAAIGATLSRLPPPRGRDERASEPAREHLTVTLRNPSPALAFFLRLQLMTGDLTREILPVLWDDNFVSLLPGEELTLRAGLAAGAPAHGRYALRVSGWNVPEVLARL